MGTELSVKSQFTTFGIRYIHDMFTSIIIFTLFLNRNTQQCFSVCFWQSIYSSDVERTWVIFNHYDLVTVYTWIKSVWSWINQHILKYYDFSASRKVSLWSYEVFRITPSYVSCMTQGFLHCDRERCVPLVM